MKHKTLFSRTRSFVPSSLFIYARRSLWFLWFLRRQSKTCQIKILQVGRPNVKKNKKILRSNILILVKYCFDCDVLTDTSSYRILGADLSMKTLTCGGAWRILAIIRYRLASRRTSTLSFRRTGYRWNG